MTEINKIQFAKITPRTFILRNYLNKSETIVMEVLLLFAPKFNPGWNNLIEMTGLSRATVARALAKLEKLGIIYTKSKHVPHQKTKEYGLADYENDDNLFKTILSKLNVKDIEAKLSLANSLDEEQTIPTPPATESSTTTTAEELLQLVLYGCHEALIVNKKKD